MKFFYRNYFYRNPLSLNSLFVVCDKNASFFSPPIFSAETEEKMLDSRSWEILKIKLKQLGLDIGRCAPGVENRMLCPKVFSLLSSF